MKKNFYFRIYDFFKAFDKSCNSIKSLCILALLFVLMPSKSVNAHFMQSQDVFRVSGEIRDSRSNESLPGVNILIEGTGTGAVSDSKGQYSIDVPVSGNVLRFSFIGYNSQTIMVDHDQVLDIYLEPSVAALDEVVVIGYGRMERREITGSISSIDGEIISSEPVYSLENLLQGRAAGVEVVADSYRPGAGATIRIRGTRSFVAGNNPLIVLDGIPVEGDLSALNPSDIESVEILKDASATAIYGSRGANGVILVTTKRGPVDATFIEYSVNAGLQEVSKTVDLMNAERYIEMQRDAARREGTYTSDENLFLDWELEAIKNGVDTDWQQEAFTTGFQQNHQLSIRGGTEKTRYSLSGNFNEHQAIVKNNDFTRYVGRLNLDQTVTDILRAGISAQISTSREHRGGNFRDLVLRSPLDWPERGEEALRHEFAVGENFPMLNLNRDWFIDQRDLTRIIANIYAELNLFDGFTYRFNFAPDFNLYERGNHSWQNSTASVSNSRTRNILYENIIDFRRVFGDIHNLKITGLYSVQTNQQTGSAVSVRGLPFEQQRFYNIGTAEETTSRSSSLDEWVLESYMLRLNYSLMGRYLFTITGRVDGSSRLAEGNKYGLFPSMAVAWLVSDESFFDQNENLNELKLRFSYGDVGNTGIRPYQTQGRVSRVGYNFGDQSVFGFQNAELANANLRWERTRQLDFGVDFGFFDYRLFGSLGVYQQNTIDLLMERQLPATSGYSSTLENVGSTQNRGLELSLSGELVRAVQPTDFNWETTIIFHTNKNEIIELYGGKDDDLGNSWFIGQPINVHFDYDFYGIWQENERDLAAQYGAQPGDIRVRDVNGDGVIGPEDRVILGSENPSWTGSISSRMNYRSFDFSFMLYTAQGVTIWSQAGGTSLGGYLNLRRGYNLNSLDIDYYTPDNPSTEYPEPRVRGHVYFTPMGYFDASYVRIRNITLGYSLNANGLTRIGLSKARIYAAVQNPFTFTDFIGLDPEGARNHDMPNYITYSMGIEISF